jgi:hypothetical protein
MKPLPPAAPSLHQIRRASVAGQLKPAYAYSREPLVQPQVREEEFARNLDVYLSREDEFMRQYLANRKQRAESLEEERKWMERTF